MKAKLTYKEFTLMAGIVVALIIMLTLWMSPVSAESGVSRKLTPSVVAKPIGKVVMEKMVKSIQNFHY